MYFNKESTKFVKLDIQCTNLKLDDNVNLNILKLLYENLIFTKCSKKATNFD